MSGHFDDVDELEYKRAKAENDAFMLEAHYERTLQDVVQLMLTYGYGQILLEINRRFDYYDQHAA